MSKVFIDVGGFEGDACRAALDPIFGFDRVIAFEPVQHCAEAIRKRIQDPRLEVVCAALCQATSETDPLATRKLTPLT